MEIPKIPRWSADKILLGNRQRLERLSSGQVQLALAEFSLKTRQLPLLLIEISLRFGHPAFPLRELRAPLLQLRIQRRLIRVLRLLHRHAILLDQRPLPLDCISLCEKFLLSELRLKLPLPLLGLRRFLFKLAELRALFVGGLVAGNEEER